VLLFDHLQSSVNRWVLVLGVVIVMTAAAWTINRTIEQPFAPVLKRWLTKTWQAIVGLLPARPQPSPAALDRSGSQSPTVPPDRSGREWSNEPTARMRAVDGEAPTVSVQHATYQAGRHHKDG
jgi:hypothetical protein